MATFTFGGMKYPTLAQVVSQVPLPAATVASINAYAGDTYSSATASVNFTVQTQPLVQTVFPLPSAYWTRPIEGENWNWYTISSNWLGTSSYWLGSYQQSGYNLYQPTGTAPSSGHIMWTKPIEFGGVVGGLNTAVLGATYYSGSSYEPRFSAELIMNGYLYFKMPLSDAGSTLTTFLNAAGAIVTVYAGAFVCLDLRTGCLVWQNNNPIFDPTWGELFNPVNPNQSGVIPSGYLWQSITTAAAVTNAEGSVVTPAQVTWECFDGFTGDWVFNITNIPQSWSIYGGPGGTLTDEQVTRVAYGPNGELLIYVLDYNTVAKTGWLALWNTTTLVENTIIPMSEWRPIGVVYNGQSGYVYQGNLITPWTWNVTITANLDGLAVNATSNTGVSITGPSIFAAFPGNLLFGGSGAISAGQYTQNPFTMWAINLNSTTGTIGSLLWLQNYTAPEVMSTNPNLGSFTLKFGPVDPITHVITIECGETFEWYGYNLLTGAYLWGPTTTNFAQDEYQYFGSGGGIGQDACDAYGNIYVQGYGGVIYCYDTANGHLLWTFGNGPAGSNNSTDNGINSPWGLMPIFLAGICDGQVYVYTNQHGNGAQSPYYLNEMIYDLNATTGQQIWSMLGMPCSAGGGGTPTPAFADGEMVYYNYYDNQIYALGMGPSQTTVNAPNPVTSLGSPIIIRGTVMDISAGTQQNEQKADFPNGVPCVSDASQSAWMQYVYMQKPEPAHVIGVPVTISVLDSNGNYYKIGTATTDASGMFTLTYFPTIPGNFTVYANFAGTNSYWGSSAETSFYAGPAAPTTPPTAAPVTGLASTGSLELGIAAVIIVIVIIGVVLAVLTMRKHA
jgi:hypothetical protein